MEDFERQSYRKWIADLLGMVAERDRLIAKTGDRVWVLERAIRKHRDARGHDRCWENDKDLYNALGEDIPERSFPPFEEAMSRCREYCANHSPDAPR